MADDNGKNGFSDFDDISEIFSGIKSDDRDSRTAATGKHKFVVHIDDSDNDSFDYDFAAFLSAEDRAEEEQRRAETRRSLERVGGVTDKTVEGRTEEKLPKKVRTPIATPVSRTVRYGSERESAFSFTDKPSGAENAERSAMPEERKAPTDNAQHTPQRKPVAVSGGEAELKRKAKKKNEPPVQPPPVSSEGEKQVVRLNTRSKFGVFSGFTGFIALTLVFTFIFSSIGLSTIGDIVAYNRDETSVTVVIENEKNGDSPTLEHVIGALHSAGLIKQKYLCIFFAKFRHYDGYNNNDKVWVPTEYLSGVYYLEPGLGLEGMLNTIKKSTSTGADTVTLTFPEGWTISQIFERLEKNGVCEASKLYANIETVAKQYDFYYNINQSGVRYLGVEGYLFPDTYEFYRNENAVSVLKKLFDNSDKKWKKSYQKKADALGYTRDEILIIASIIQREAANSSQMGNVSSVLHNRLKSSTYPSLQCNSTLDYVTNSVKSYVDANLAELYANAYNTYRIEGLPPGPICNPGKDAIEAALEPNDTNYYFFVHNNRGKIYLSENYAQFQKDCIQAAKDNAS